MCGDKSSYGELEVFLDKSGVLERAENRVYRRDFRIIILSNSLCMWLVWVNAPALWNEREAVVRSRGREVARSRARSRRELGGDV